MAESADIIILQRDVEGSLVPSGARIFLQRGTEVRVTQAMGDSFTVNVFGNLVRIAGDYADALGQESTAILDLPDDASVEDILWARLKTCYDPEIPVNIVDLGLIYNCDIQALENEQYAAHIKMTLTAPGCGMGPVIAEEVKYKALLVPGITEAEVEIVFDPPWSQDNMSEAAKLQLGLL